MDPRDLNPSSPNGSGEWLPRYILEALHEILPAIGRMAADVQNLATNQAVNKADILKRVEDVRTELKDHILRIEGGQPSQSAAKSTMVRSLFGSVGAWVLERLPWKHAALMGLGAVGALLGHFMPERVKNAGVGLAKIWMDLWGG